jgi:hypothetical protein
MPASFSQRSMAATAVCTAARGIATVSTCKDVSQGNQCPIAHGERIAGEAGQEIGDVAAAEGRGLAWLAGMRSGDAAHHEFERRCAGVEVVALGNAAGADIESTVRYLGVEIDDAIEMRSKSTSELPGQSCRALPNSDRQVWAICRH